MISMGYRGALPTAHVYTVRQEQNSTISSTYGGTEIELDYARAHDARDACMRACAHVRGACVRAPAGVRAGAGAWARTHASCVCVRDACGRVGVRASCVQVRGYVGLVRGVWAWGLVSAWVCWGIPKPRCPGFPFAPSPLYYIPRAYARVITPHAIHCARVRARTRYKVPGGTRGLGTHLGK
mgnify:CR=1 FL=1